MAVIIDGTTGITVSGNITASEITASTGYKSNTASTAPVFEDANGTQIGTLCRAWVSFNGTGTVAILGSFNVSTVTDNGVGSYAINFTNPMPDANYVAPQMSRGNSNTFGPNAISNLTTASYSVFSYDSGNTLIDREILGCAVFR